MTDSLEGRVLAALAAIRNPRLDNDLLSAGMIRDLAVAPDGGVSFTFLLAPETPPRWYARPGPRYRAWKGCGARGSRSPSPIPPAPPG